MRINGHPQECVDLRQEIMEAAVLFHDGLLKQCEGIIALHGDDPDAMRSFGNLLDLLMFSIEMQRDRARLLTKDDE